MVLYQIDNRENLSLEALEFWCKLHPKSAQTITIQYETLECGDVLKSIDNTTHLCEIKIGNDARSSLNSGHLEDQLNRMVQYYNEQRYKPKYPVFLYLIYADTVEYRIDTTTLGRMAHLASERGITFHYCSTLERMWDKIYALAPPDPKYVVPTQVSVAGLSPIAAGLSAAVSGVSAEFAAFVISVFKIKNMRQIVDLTETEWGQIGQSFYHRQYGEMACKIYTTLNGIDHDDGVP